MTMQSYMSDLMMEHGASEEQDVHIICDNHAHHNGSSLQLLGDHQHDSDKHQYDGHLNRRRPRRSRSNSFNNLMTGFGVSCRRMVCRWDSMTHDSRRSQSKPSVPVRSAEKDDPTSTASSEALSSQDFQPSVSIKIDASLELGDDYERGIFNQTIKHKPTGPLHHLKLHLPKLHLRGGGHTTPATCRGESARLNNTERPKSKVTCKVTWRGMEIGTREQDLIMA